MAESRNVRVLIADDDPILLNVLEEALRLSGYEPTTAANVDALLATLRTARFDLVLTDMFAADLSQAPNMLRHLQEAAGDTPILLITGWTSAGEKSRELGAADVLIKPFDLDELLQRIEALARPG